ncbi:MAG TPA: HAD family phosphatase [Bryobacteraceae bacterium]|nr:HAD family phosphatase [Bryobacteraceae bacterium]
MHIARGLALVFDLDGVIVDSMPMHTEAWRIYLERLGISCPDIQEQMHGRRNDEIVLALIDANLPAEEVFRHGAEKERLFREMMQPRLDAMIVPGLRDFLERTNGAPRAVASNAEPANIDFVLDNAGLRRYFPVVVDGHQVGQPKPWPDIYLRAAELLRTAPGNCIIFEDSPTGIAAAKAAGGRVAGVATHTTELAGVDVLVRDFDDPALVQWLEQQQHNS